LTLLISAVVNNTTVCPFGISLGMDGDGNETEWQLVEMEIKSDEQAGSV